MRVRPGRAGGAATRSAGASGAGIHAAGAGAKLAPAEWMLNYSRPQGLSHSSMTGEAPGEALSRAGEGRGLETAGKRGPGLSLITGLCLIPRRIKASFGLN